MDDLSIDAYDEGFVEVHQPVAEKERDPARPTHVDSISA